MRDPGLSSVKPMMGWFSPWFFIDLVQRRVSHPFPLQSSPHKGRIYPCPWRIQHTTPRRVRIACWHHFLPYSVPAETEASGSFCSRKPGQKDQHSPPSLRQSSLVLCAVHAGTPSEACGSLHSDVFKCLKQHTQEFRENPT